MSSAASEQAALVPVSMALLFAGHLLADFLFQTRARVEGKRTSRRELRRHGLEVFAVQAAVLLPFALDRGRALPGLVLIAWAHVQIDALKIRIEAARGVRLAWLVLDQLAHALVILIVVWLWKRIGHPDALGPILVEPTRLLNAAALAGAYAFAVNGGSAVVAAVLEGLRRDSATGRPGAQVPVASPGAPGAGHLIGILERLILVTLVWNGEWGAIGFVLAAKSVARFKELEERAFAETYLVGTLTSFLVAGALGSFLRLAL